jgi:hypothetical protein
MPKLDKTILQCWKIRVHGNIALQALEEFIMQAFPHPELATVGLFCLCHYGPSQVYCGSFPGLSRFSIALPAPGETECVFAVCAGSFICRRTDYSCADCVRSIGIRLHHQCAFQPKRGIGSRRRHCAVCEVAIDHCIPKGPT